MTGPTPREAADTCPGCGSDDPMVTLGGDCENAWHYGADPDDDVAPDLCPQCGTELEDHLWLDLESCVRKSSRATTSGDDRGRELADLADRLATFAEGLDSTGHAGAHWLTERAEQLRALGAETEANTSRGFAFLCLECGGDSAHRPGCSLPLAAAPPAQGPAETEAEKPPLLAAVHRLGGQGRIRAFERSEDGRWFPACLRHWEDPFSDALGTFETGDAAQLSLVPHILRWHPQWLTEAERLAATPPSEDSR